ncbi:MAG TPA: HNH endonuclease [Candidatus Krumholzibacteria bacterium]|nr:HNH endonuclease [Candidatus Krumholzibacteria bacterium]
MFESLAFLSDQQVRDGARAAVANERESTLTVLNFLIEIEKRRLYLNDGYSSIFDFCTSAWGYSSSSAWRRIQTARCIMRFPRVLGMLERNEVNLSTIAQASRVLNEDNCNQLLPRIGGKSQREVESIASEYREEPPPRERARTVMVRLPEPRAVTLDSPLSALASEISSLPDSAAHEALPSSGPTERSASITSVAPEQPALASRAASEQPACENSAYCRSGSNSASPAGSTEDTTPIAATTSHEPMNPEPSAPAHSGPESSTAGASDRTLTPASASVVLQKRIALTLSVPAEFMAKIERLRAVTWHRLPASASFTHVLDHALDVAIAAKDPAAKYRRRKQRDRKPRNSKTPMDKRYVPPDVRDEVAARDAYRCTYVSPNGRRCTATTGLQVDHIQPVARGGTSTIDNLRLLCAKHNRFEAQRLMGRGDSAVRERGTPRSS